jgi:hypothetical protein
MKRLSFSGISRPVTTFSVSTVFTGPKMTRLEYKGRGTRCDFRFTVGESYLIYAGASRCCPLGTVTLADGKTVTHSFHLVEMPPRVSAATLVRPPNRTSVEGLQHAECLVLMRFGAPIVSLARLQMRRFAMFAQWDDEPALDRFLDADPFGRRSPPAGTFGCSTCAGTGRSLPWVTCRNAPAPGIQKSPSSPSPSRA